MQIMRKYLAPLLLLLAISSAALAGPPAGGGGTVNPMDALQILRNISKDFPAILDMVFVVSTAIGLYLVGSACYSAFLITNSANNSAWTGRSQPTHKEVLSSLITGVILSAPIFFQVAIGRAFFGTDVLTDSAFVIQTNGMGADAKFVYECIMNLASVAGAIYVLIGWLHINAYHHGKRQEWFDGFVSIIGGSILYVLPNFLDVIMKWTNWNFVGTLVI